MVLKMEVKDREVGIDLLRVFLAFQVVLVHGWNGYTYPYEPGLPFPFSFLSRTGTVAVHAFFFYPFILLIFGGWQRTSNILDNESSGC